MNHRNRITIIRDLRLAATQALLTLAKEKNGGHSTVHSSSKAGEAVGGTALATSVGQTVTQAPLRYRPEEYRSRLSQAKDAMDYSEAIQLIEEGVNAKLPFLADDNAKRDIESIVRGLKEGGEVQDAMVLANYCFRNKVNYETRPNSITTRTLIIAGQKIHPIETALLTISALECGVKFEQANDEKMIMTTAVATRKTESHEGNLAYGQLVFTSIKHNHLKDSQFIETGMAMLGNPEKKEEETSDSQITQRGEITYNIAVEYLDKVGKGIIEIIDDTRIDKTIHDLRRIPGQIPNAFKLLLKAMKCDDLDTNPITVQSTISTISTERQDLVLDKKLGETLQKVIGTALEKYERGSFNWETFDVLCQSLMQEESGKSFAIQIATKCAEYGYILRKKTYENIYNATADSEEVKKRGDLRQKREKLLELIPLGN